MADHPASMADIVEEACRVVRLAEAGGVAARLIGGTAVAVTSRPQRALQREIKDIDLVIPRGTQEALTAVLADAGYRPNERFNVMRGDRRLLFFDDERERQLDVFVGEFAMCHRLDLDDRLGHDGIALPVADLLLTKLQTVELNPKDLIDICALLLACSVTDGNGDAASIDGLYMARICADDWGWHRTVGLTFERVLERLPGLGLSPADQRRIVERVEQLQARIVDEPKSRRWRRRAVIGDRRRWHEEPEEVD